MHACVCDNNFIVQHVRSAVSVCRFQIQPKCGAALPRTIMCTLHRIIIIIRQYDSTVYIGIAFIYLKHILKKNSDLTFSFKLYPFLVITMSITYKKEYNYSQNINVFRCNIREKQRNMYFHVLCLLFLLLFSLRLILLKICMPKP